VGSKVYNISDLSIATDSGWRGVDKHRIGLLIEDFKDGKYGTNVLGKPSTVVKPAPDNKFEEVTSLLDGKFLLDNGKSTISALRKLKARATLPILLCPIH